MSEFIPDQLDEMSRKELLEFAQTAHEENVRLCQQLAKANERYMELAEYKFVHPSNGDSRTVSIDRQFIIDNLVDEIYEKIDCDCEPIGETNVVECECDEYFEQFELLESEQLRKEQNQ